MKLCALEDLVALRGAAHGLNLHARRPVLARLLGVHHSAHRGMGLEFEEVRPYVAGDDVRHIDWRVTARRGRPHTKLFREERERPVWLVADLHPGLFFGTRRQLKSTLLLRAAALLAWAAAEGGDRIGGVTPADGFRVLMPRARSSGVLPLLETMLEAQPTAPATADPAHLCRLLDRVVPLAQPGSLIVVLSDFLELRDDVVEDLTILSARNECWLLQVADPLERDGLPDGRFRLGLPGRLRMFDGRGSRDTWQAAWAERQRAFESLCVGLRLPLHCLMTDEAVEDVLPTLVREPAWAR